MERSVDLKEGSIYLREFGNTNILENHIYFFEKEIDKEVKNIRFLPNPSISSCPYFSVWIRLNTELLVNLMFYNYHRYTGCDWEEIINQGFKFIKEKIENLIIDNKKWLSQTDFSWAEVNKSINLVIELRHSIQHGGIPNILRKINNRQYIEAIYEMLNPINFKETKLIFQKAKKFSEVLPKTTISVGTK